MPLRKRGIMKIVFLDEKTLGTDLEFSRISEFGDYIGYETTNASEIIERAYEAEVIITNKVIIDQEIMAQLPNLKLICEAATGLNNIDVEYAEKQNIKVLNAKGYSTSSVVQHSFSMLFYLLNNLDHYNSYTKNLDWIKSDSFSSFTSFL